MRCSICGAKLKKEGDICNKCYKEFQEEEDLKKDVKEIFKIKRKYSTIYELLKYILVIILFVMAIIFSLESRNFLNAFIQAFAMIFILGLLLFIEKRIAKATIVTFYEKKVEYSFNLYKINKTKIIKYSDLEDIVCNQTLKQKKFGMGDLCFYSKGIIPGLTILGFQIKNVENVLEITEKIKEIIGTIKK